MARMSGSFLYGLAYEEILDEQITQMSRKYYYQILAFECLEHNGMTLPIHKCFGV